MGLNVDFRIQSDWIAQFMKQFCCPVSFNRPTVVFEGRSWTPTFYMFIFLILSMFFKFKIIWIIFKNLN